MNFTGNTPTLAVLLASALGIASCSIKNPVLSYATVLQPAYGLRSCVLQYEQVNGKTRFIKGPCIAGLVKGEKFLFVFDSLHPQRNSLLNEFPLFESTEETAVTYGKVTRCMSSNFFSRISFRYEVKGKKYRKKQWVTGLRYMKEGTPCRIEYWAANPARAILKTKN